jgi:hypothetical protein
MTTIIQAISNHLKKHKIKHDAYWQSMGIYQYPHAREYIITILHTENTIKLTDYTNWNHNLNTLNYHTLDLADPDLLPIILKLAQQCQHKY